MKKIGKTLGKALYHVLSFIDRIIITPITKLLIKITDSFKNNSKDFEKFLNNQQTLVVLSLIFALIAFFVINTNSSAIINNSAEILYSQPVHADYNEEAYVIEGLPETVDVTMVGKKSYLYLAKQYSSNLQVSADLTGLKPGKHKVTLEYSQGLNNINYKMDPSNVTVVIYEKVSKTKELTYDVLHKDSLNTKLVISNIDLSRNDCIIKGAEYKLNQVATVKALVDIDEITNPHAGTITLKEVPLVAYDASGNVVDIEIVPKTVDAQITIESPSKEVPIKVVPIGADKLSFGKSIKSITSSVSTVTIYGDQTALDNIEYIPVEIDVTNLSNDKEFNLNITKPSGIREISSKTLNVKITLDNTVTKEFENIRITPINLNSNYKAQAAGEADGQVTVIAYGTASVINSLSSSSITATIDLAGYTEGTYEVEVKIVGEDLKANYESKTEKVTIKIIKAS